MTEAHPTDGDVANVEWTRGRGAEFAEPLGVTAPYVEVKLEHPGLEPTRLGQSFFPDAVPYTEDGIDRVFYWRDAFAAVPPPPADWTGVCATPQAVDAVVHDGRHEPVLLVERDNGHEVVVDGTVAGDCTTAVVAGYDPPTVTVRHVTPDAVELGLPTGVELVPPDTRRRIELPEQAIRTEQGDRVTTTPELVVRYPGDRRLSHPAPRGGYHLFPSFGIDLDDVPRPLAVPTTSGELDHETLADRLDVALASRPYPQRVLWQAFAYTAFDPNNDESAEVAQLPSGELAVQSG